MARSIVISLFLLFGLTACNESEKAEPFVIGEEVKPPKGWVDYCLRNKDDTDCK